MLYGPTRRTPAAEARDRRVRVSRLYVAWMRGEIERPDLDEEEEELWETMEGYVEAAKRVAEHRVRGGQARRGWG